MKLDRARHHLDCLRGAEQEWRSRAPVTMAVKEEDCGDGSRLYRIIATVTEPPPAEWATIIGDVVHNARSAMDNAVWAAADPTRRGKHTQLPICRTRSGWTKQSATQLAGLSTRQVHLLAREQPFHHPAQLVPLLTLRELSNQDKHRALHAVALESEREWMGIDNAEATFEHLARRAPGIVDQGEVVRIRAVPKDPSKPMTVHPNAEYVVAILGAPTPRGALDTLDACCWFAEVIVGHLEHPDRFASM